MHTKRQDKEYDPDNYEYMDDDDDDTYSDDDDYDEDTPRNGVNAYEEEDGSEDEETEDDEPPIDWDEEILDMNDLSGGKNKFNPDDFDFNKILEDYNSGDEARVMRAKTQALKAMDALVKHVINKHYPTYRAKYYDDMLQEGRLAIVETMGKYTGKCAPSSFFYTNIKHQIQVFVAEHVHRTTRHYAAQANTIRKAEIALSQIDGKDSHDDLTISIFTGIPLTTVIETRKQVKAADFVELNTNVDNETDTMDFGNPVDALWQKSRVQAVHDAIKRLSPTEMKVISLMYGLDGNPPLNMPAIAAKLHIKPEQARKIAQDACRKMSHDKKLKADLDVHDRLTAEQTRSIAEVPFTEVTFGEGVDFFDEISEESEPEPETITNFDDMLESMKLDDTNTTET